MKAILFDLDGTLWDTTDTVVGLWNEVLKKRCPEYKMTKEIMASFMGKNKAQFCDGFFVNMEKERAEQIISEIFLSEQKYIRQHGARLYDKVIETLDVLKKDYLLAVVSNCQSGYLDAFLDYYKLRDVFSDFESAGATSLSKGENIALVLRRNNIEKAIYVGDTQSDEIASKQAKVPFVFASYGFGEVTSYDAQISAFSEIIYVAEKLL